MKKPGVFTYKEEVVSYDWNRRGIMGLIVVTTKMFSKLNFQHLLGLIFIMLFNNPSRFGA